MTTTETSARSNAVTKRKVRTDRAGQTFTASIPAAQCKAPTGAVDHTSAPKVLPASNAYRGADQTSTASRAQPKRNREHGAVDHTSTGASNSAVKRKKQFDAFVDQAPVSSIGTPKSTSASGDAGPILADPVLGVMAYAVDDLEMVRIAFENRLRALTSEHGLTLGHPDVARMAAMADVLKAQEHQAILNMKRVVRRHPLWGYMKPIAGVGEKQFARLLAVIGDPYWNDLHDRPRAMRELRAYCGWHVVEIGHVDNGTCDSKPAGVGVAPKRQRGAQHNWNDEARKRTWLIAESCMKQRNSIYRDVYDAARKQYEDTVHPSVCFRCGPKGKPVQVGSPRSAGHQHAMALRKVAVAFLADLWWEARRLHEHPAVKESPETRIEP